MESGRMGTGRLEAFSDGVIAVVVTIMVLELHAPDQPTLAALGHLWPTFCAYSLSFLVVAIMWVNHHHMIHAARRITPALLWCNLTLLFWMSLVPFVTDYLGKNHKEPLAVALYGLDLALCGAAFSLVRLELIHQTDEETPRRHHVNIQRKNLFSVALYLVAAGSAFLSVYISYAIYIFIPASYFLPEKIVVDEAAP